MIDIGEKWAAVLGVDPILNKEMPRIYAEDKRRVDGLELEIVELAKSICSGSNRVNWPNVGNIKKIGDKLTIQFTENDIVELIRKLPQDAKTPYRDQAMHQFMFLAQAFPRNSRSTLAGQMPIDPSSFDVFRFEGLYRIADDPLYALRLISGAAILKSQVDATRQLWPSISLSFDAAIHQAIEDKKTANKNYEVPYKADIGIRAWRGIPVLIAPYQAAYLTEKEKLNNQAPPTQAQLAPESKSSLSAAQQALYSTVGR